MGSVRNKAQATLEFTVTFVIMVILLFSLLAIWKKWADKIIERQQSYSGGRVEQGTYGPGKGTPIPYMP